MEPSNIEEVDPQKRSARKPITDDDVLRVDAALLKTNGHRAHAAQMLGLPVERLKSIIDNTRSLREKWAVTKKDVPDGFISEIDRGKEPLPTLTAEHQAIAEAITRQDALVSGSWAKLGYTDDQKNFLLNLQQAYTTNLQGTLNLTYGGMVHAFTRLLFTFEELVKRIEHIDANPKEYIRLMETQFGVNETKGPHEYRCELYDRLIAVSAELRKVNSDATKANWVRAQIERLKSEDGKDGKRKKAGWSPRKVVEATAAPVKQTPPPTLPDEDPV